MISPCDKYIASGSKNGALCVWRVNTKQTYEAQAPLVEVKNVHIDEVNAVDWGRNNCNFLASVGDDRFLYIWDIDVNGSALIE